MRNCSSRLKDQIEEMEMPLAMTELDLMDMSTKMKKIEILNQTLEKDNTSMTLERKKN